VAGRASIIHEGRWLSAADHTAPESRATLKLGIARHGGRKPRALFRAVKPRCCARSNFDGPNRARTSAIGRGVALATAMGKQLARRLIEGETAEVDMPVTTLKPIRFHEFWPVAVKSVLLYGRIRDRLGL
jgi:hypothetical protein